MKEFRPQEGICTEPTIHGWVLFLDVTTDDIQELKVRLRKFPSYVEQMTERFSGSNLSCVLAIGEAYWDILSSERPIEFAPLPIYEGNEHPLAPAQTDLALILRSDRYDANYFAGRVLLDLFHGVATLWDEKSTFRYLDGRDLFGFFLEPKPQAGDELSYGVKRQALTYVQQEDDVAFQGGSYLWLQHFYYDLRRWDVLDIGEQQAIMGRQILTGKPIETDKINHTQLCRFNAFSDEPWRIWTVRMPVADIQTASELTLYWSASQQEVELLMQARHCRGPQQEIDPLLEYQRIEKNFILFAPSMDWLLDLD